MKNLSLILPGTSSSKKVKWDAIPRIDETVWYKEKRYIVTDVWHSMDMKEIKIFLSHNPI